MALTRRLLPSLVERLALRGFPPSSEYLHAEGDGFKFGPRKGAHEFPDMIDAGEAANKYGGWPVIIEAAKPAQNETPAVSPTGAFAELERRRLA